VARLAYTWRTFARELTVLVIAAIWWVPFYFLVVMALKPDAEVFSSPLSLPSRINLGSFSEAWKGADGVTLGAALINSLEITAGTVAVLIALGSICAYVIARRNDRIGTALYLLFVLGIILPYQLAVVPSYVALRGAGLVPSKLGLILLYSGLLMPLAVFMYTGFVRALPRDYEEAAYVDGARRMRTFARVVFPLMRPITATVAILTGLIIWNDFFLQLIFLGGSREQTLPVEIYSFVGEFTARWNLVFASVVVAIAPVLAFFLVAQRQLVRGFTGGIKS
jgi:raffinose/stachyose/melibiose transport system permease protein